MVYDNIRNNYNNQGNKVSKRKVGGPDSGVTTRYTGNWIPGKADVH